MKALLLPIYLICYLSYCQSSKALEFQQDLIKEYSNPRTNPLKYVTSFKGLTFFPINDNFVFEAHFEAFEKEKVRKLLGTRQSANFEFIEFGELKFTYNDTEYSLSVYHGLPNINGDFSDTVIVPFWDKTNGISTSDFGRVLRLSYQEFQENPKITIDFNRSRSPDCVYSKRFRCPIPPIQNYLDFLLVAGASLEDK